MSGPMAHLNRPRINPQQIWMSPTPVNTILPPNGLYTDIRNLISRVESLEYEKKQTAHRMDELENAVKLAAEADSKLVDSHYEEMGKTRALEERVAELEYLVSSLQMQPPPVARFRRNASTSSFWGDPDASYYSGSRRGWVQPNVRNFNRQPWNGNGRNRRPHRQYGSNMRLRPDFNNYATGGSTFGPSEEYSALSDDGSVIVGMDPKGRSKFPYGGEEKETVVYAESRGAVTLDPPIKAQPDLFLNIPSAGLRNEFKNEGVSINQKDGYSSDESSNGDPGEGSDESFDYVDSDHGR
ncbi:hypothetical protein BJ508DRAFT_411331, partial [Ascobolus immersus RN42]